MAIEWLATTRMLFGSLARKVFFLSVRLLFLGPQTIWWRISGIHGQIRRIQHPESRDTRRAQALTVLSWCKPDFLFPPSLRDFILMHDEFVDAKYVLENDHVTLFFLDPNENVAVFGEGEPGQLLWKSTNTPFLTYTMFTMARRMIIMPISTFNELCDSLPDPKGSLVMMSNTGRCGSTLLVQLFERTKKVVAISEPYPFNDIARMYKAKGDCEELKKFTRRLTRIYCKPLTCMKGPLGYLIKPSSSSIGSMEAVRAVYKDAALFYLYRDMAKVSPSIFKLSFVLPSARLVYLLCRLSGNMVESVFESAGFPTEGTNRTLQDDFTAGIFQAIVASGSYTNLRKKGYQVHGLSFDEMVKNKEDYVKAIFKLSGLPLDLVPDAMQAFSQDSQKNSPISREALAKLPTLVYSEEDKVRASQLMVEFGYPPLDQPCRLEGTIDVKAVLAN